MYKARFKVLMEEPMILPNSDRTERSLNCLDYISGNIFLGIVAGALYKEGSPRETLDLFHNGNVQFGNAYLSLKDKQSYPIPAVWHKEKGTKLISGIYFHHLLTNEEKRKLAENGIQIKQERKGYFVMDADKKLILNAQKKVVLKSAYNNERRSARKREMYLYEFLEAGQEFIFEIRAISTDYLDMVSKKLIGKKHISKSKSSEFGGVVISSIGSIYADEKVKIIPNKDHYVIYAHSNLAFINKYGEPSWNITAKQLGFNNAKINYEKSQLYFDKFHTRNGKRKSHDSDRLIIKQGSVFYVEKDENIDSKIIINEAKINKGIGVFLSEGYGRVIVDPEFLNVFDNSQIEYVNSNKHKEMLFQEDQLALNSILKEREDMKNSLEKIYSEVEEFIQENRNICNSISASQWGAIRSYIYQSKMDENPNKKLFELVFHKKDGYLNHGMMSKKWDGEPRKVLEESIPISMENGEEVISDYYIEKLLLLCTEIPKQQSV